MSNSTYIMFGDSHSRAFMRTFKTNWFRASSARGLCNKESRTKIGPKIHDMLSSINDDTNVIFYFGKVDLDFIINYKYNSQDSSLAELSEHITETADMYINYIKSTGMRNILVFEPPVVHLSEADMLTTLRIDGHRSNASSHLTDKDKVELHRVDIHEKMIPREDHITLYDLFNTRLKSLCSSNGFTFVEINKYFKQPSGEYIVPSRYIKDTTDHHLHDNCAELFLKSMETLGYIVE